MRSVERFDAALGCLPAIEGFLAMQTCREAVATLRVEGVKTSISDLFMPTSDQGRGAEPGIPTGYRCVTALKLVGQDPGVAPLGWPRLARLHSAVTGLEPGLSQPANPASRAALDALARLLRDGGHPRLFRAGVLTAGLYQLNLFGPASALVARIATLDALRSMRVPGSRGLALSGPLARRADEYSFRLRTLDSENWGKWLELFLNCVRSAAVAGERALKQFALLREKQRSKVTENLGHSVPRGLQMIERLFVDPLTTVRDVRGVTATSYVAANQLVARFVDLGILAEVTGYKRNRTFRFNAIVDLFDDGPSSAAAEGSAPPELKGRAYQAVPAARPRPVARAPERQPAESPRRTPLADHLL